MNNKMFINKTITYGLIIIIGIVVFFILGDNVPLVAKDTDIYTTITYCDGVMPIYPLYSYYCKMIFGVGKAFDAMVIIQGILSLIITVGFTIYIKRICCLSDISTVIVYCLSLMPFVAYLPEANISQIILTESLAFPLTYVFVFLILKGYVDRKIRYSFFSIVLSMILYLIRSQLLIAIIFACAMMFFQLIRLYKNSFFLLICKLLIIGVISIVSYKISFNLFLGYLNHFVPSHMMMEEDGNEDDNEAKKDVNKSGVTISIMTASSDEEVDTVVTSSQTNGNETESSQFRRLVMNRGVMLLNDSDYLLYDSVEKQGSYNAAVASIRENDSKGLLVDNPIDWTKKWDDQGLLSERNVDYAVAGMSDYYSILYPELPEVYIWDKVSKDLMEFSIDAMIHHPGILCTLMVRLFFAGLQASVFAQPPGLYVLSEIITLLIIIYSLFLWYWSRNRDMPSSHLFRIASLGVIVYAFIVSAVHQPLQRYLLYFQGIFYIGLFVLTVELLYERFPGLSKLVKQKEDD